MSFIWPAMLYLLLLVPLYVLLYLYLQGRRRRVAALYSNFGLTQSAMRSPGIRRHVPVTIFMSGLTILLFSLSRPQTVVNLPRVEGTVILAFDVSGSMAADDMQPTRMDAAKAAAREFVLRQPSTVNIGVVAFSDDGFSVQVPTNDQAAILAAIDRLKPQRGTSLGQGILASLNTIAEGSAQNSSQDSSLLPTPTPMPEGTYSSAIIVMLTDGENNELPNPLEAAQIASDRGVRIHTIGVGSAEGISLHVNGFNVFTQLNEPLLQQIAQMTDGKYYHAANKQELQTIYENIDPQLVIKPEKMEITSLLAGASILVLLIGGVFSLIWFSRLP
ncbi:MAG TPA: VWA domain-containing protein [Anaerolineales bacterium]|nr:VWA domain-containing protein [Anaerolineales bacterium]